MSFRVLLTICVFLISYNFINGQSPNYSEDIAPIIYNKCLQCHHVGGISSLSLETYANTVTNAGMIQHVTSSGEMPPWPPDTLYKNYAYENVLSLQEINSITNWISNGSPIGDTSLLPTMPTFNNTSQLGMPDLELQIPTYTSTATTNSDDYVCISIPTGLLQDKKVKAIEVIAGNVQIVHHVLVYIDAFPNNSTIITTDCMGGEGSMIYSYAPGSKPLIFPEENNNKFGSILPANSSITLAMHYPEGSYGQIDSTKVRFYFYPENTTIREVSNDFLINEGLFGIPFYLPPNQITQISGTYGPTIEDYSFMSVFPHMHLLGKDFICYAVTPLNDTINLIKINNWDFEWQGSYFFKKFIKIPAGSTIYAYGNYDNTASAINPNPTTVQSGLNTENEMFIAIFQYLPYQLGDENISIENNFSTNINESAPYIKVDKTNYIFDILGRKNKLPTNTPFININENGHVVKKIIVN